MAEFGLIGHPLTHSFSKMYFELKFAKLNLRNHKYSLFDLKTFEDLIAFKEKSSALKGLNVTIPYKQSILSLLDDISTEAEEIGAVNTVLIKNNKWHGHNTDVYGFEKSLGNIEFNKTGKILVLGSGGASKAVQFVLKKNLFNFLVVSRKPYQNQISYSDINKNLLEAVSMIINTSPLGMYPEIHEHPPLPYELISADTVLFDLIYNPEQTEFLKKGKKIGCYTKNGFEMLKMQADKSWDIWNG